MMAYTGKTIRLDRPDARHERITGTRDQVPVDFWKWYTYIVGGINVVLVIICWWLIILGL